MLITLYFLQLKAHTLKLGECTKCILPFLYQSLCVLRYLVSVDYNNIHELMFL